MGKGEEGGRAKGEVGGEGGGWQYAGGCDELQQAFTQRVGARFSHRRAEMYLWGETLLPVRAPPLVPRSAPLISA